MARPVLWWVLGSLLLHSAWAQRSANWRMFKTDDGMAESSSVALTIGPKGSVWVKHRDASEMSVLDGYRIRTLPSPGPDNYRVYESRTGMQLWSLYATGLLVYANQQWIHRPVPEIQAEFKADPRRQVVHQIPLVPAEQNHVLFLLSDKLMEYDLTTKKAIVIKHVSETGLGRFNEMTESRQDGLWITGAKGLGKLAGQVRHLRSGAVWTEYLLDPSLHIENLQRPFEDDQGGITAAATDAQANSRKVLLHFNGNTWTVRQVDSAKVSQAWPGWDNTLWAFSLDSLFRFDPPPFAGITREKIWAGQYKDIATETNSAFWLATSEGLYRYAPHLWRTPAPLEDFNSHVHAMLQDEADRIWFGSSESLVRLQEGSWKTNKWPEGWEGSFETGDRLYRLPADRLLATAGERALLFSPETEQFETVAHPSGRPIRFLGQLPDLKVVVQVVAPPQASSGLLELEQFDGSHFEPWLRIPMEGYYGGLLSCLVAQANGDVWIGGAGGLVRYRDGQFETFGAAQGFRAARASWIEEVGEGKLWSGAADKVFEFNGKTWSLLRSGLDRITKVVRGRDEKIWLGTSQGLYSYTPANRSWVGYGVEEGLPSPGISEVMVDRKGRLWAGTTRGVSMYHPDADLSPPKTLPPVLENANGGQTTGERVSLLLKAVDRWNETPSDRLLYATRLDEGQWTPYSDSALKVFDRLGAGKHRFEVRAMDRNGNEDPDSAVLNFWVVVAWYKDPRLLVIMLSGAVLVVFFAGLAVNRHLQLIRSYAEVETIVALRTRELERANEELIQSQKMKALGTLAAGIAHDFNNILSIIKGSAQIIQTNLDDRQKVLVRLSRIHSVVEQGSGIVKSILGLSRVKEKDLAETDLNAVVEETIRLVGDRFLHEVTVEFKAAPRLPSVLMPRELMQQMLLNLILNAADAMEHRGQVLLQTGERDYLPLNLALSPARSARYLFVSVQDSGCGISAEILPRIFEPFFTTKALSTRRGTGLGLSIVYELARELGYGLEVVSAVGKGSTFTIILPVQEAEAPLQA